MKLDYCIKKERSSKKEVAGLSKGYNELQNDDSQLSEEGNSGDNRCRPEKREKGIGRNKFVHKDRRKLGLTG